VSVNISNVSAEVTGTPTPAMGDWIINDATTVTGETINVTGDIIVNDGGSLTLDSATIKMNCTTNGQYGIIVKSGGSLVIQADSLITKHGTGKYHLIVNSGATFSMQDSTIEYCGYEIDDYDNQEGWKFSGPYIACDGSIQNSVIDNCLQGLVVEGNIFTIKDSTVKNSKWHNLEGRNTKNFIIDNCECLNSIEKCNVEFYEGCTGSIKNCIISGAGHNVVWCKTNNTVTIENNLIEGAPYNGIWAGDNCDLTIKNNIIKDNDQCGIQIEENSKIVCIGNTIKNNGNPDGSSWELEQNGHGIFITDGLITTVKDNIIQENYANGIELRRCSGTIEGTNTIISGSKDPKDDSRYGVHVGPESDIIINDITIENFTMDGINGFNSTLAISNNKIKNCGDCGIYGEGCTITQSGNTFTSVAKNDIFQEFWIQIKVIDNDNAVLPEADVTVKDSAGNIVWEGTSNTEGTIPNQLLKGSETYTIDAEWGDMSKKHEFTPEKTGQVEVKLKEKENGGSTDMVSAVWLILVIFIMAIVYRKRRIEI
jgi:parallel beta-helix repeat protein